MTLYTLFHYISIVPKYREAFALNITRNSVVQIILEIITVTYLYQGLYIRSSWHLA
jgi:hypothetical protein